jgi:hypothetical protein
LYDKLLENWVCELSPISISLTKSNIFIFIIFYSFEFINFLVN